MIDTLKNLHLDTDLEAGAEIVAPADPAWRLMADHLRRVIREGTGLDLPVRHGVADVPASWPGVHRILLGSAVGNPAVLTLYRCRMAFTDDFYPGEGGFEVRTVHNPFGRGANALLLGASDVAGAASAVERLRDEIARTGPRLGRLNLAASRYHDRLPRVDPAECLSRARDAFARNLGRSAIEGAITSGFHHHLTGDAAAARAFRDVLVEFAERVDGEHGGDWGFEHMIAPSFWTSRLVRVWDLIEESDVFSDEDRLRLTNALLGLTRHLAGMPIFEQEPEPDIRQNHSTFAALSLSLGARYLRLYYGITEFERQERIAERLFAGQAASYKPNDDAGGGGYCWLAPNHLVAHDLMRGDLRFFDGGHFRRLADYAILTTDNMGVPCAFGDCGTWGPPGRPGALLVETLSKAAWHYGDGRYAWAMEWLGSPVPGEVGSYFRRIDPVRPDDLAGIAVAPLEPAGYAWVRRERMGGSGLHVDTDVGDTIVPAGRAREYPEVPGVPPDRAFDKLSLRAGFDERDEYLLLDGLSTFAHGHEDGNSIIRLTWRGRLFLDETDYIRSRPEHHNSVTIACDGRSGRMPPLVRLDWAEDLGDFALTRTTVPGVNGADWSRTLFWKKGRWILVADAIRLREDADYDIRCLWRTLGEARLGETGLSVEQEGVAFHIQFADGAIRALADEPLRVPDRDPWAAYPHARGGIRILSARKATHGLPGEIVRFYHLLSVGNAGEPPDVRIHRAGPGLVRIAEGEECLLFGDPNDDAANLGDLLLSGQAFCAATDRIAGFGIRSFRLGSMSASLSAPCTLRLNPEDGRGEVRASREAAMTMRGAWGARVTLGGLQHRAGVDGGMSLTLEPGAHPIGFPPFDPDPLVGEALEKGAFREESRPRRNLVRMTRSPLRRAWNHGLEGGVSALDVADGQMVAGTTAGELVRLDPDGKTAWSRATGREIRALRLADLDGDGLAEVILGGRECAVQVLDPSGSFRWSRPLSPSHGRDQVVNAVAVADLTGDGAIEIVAVTDGWLCHCFGPNGAPLWTAPVRYHAVQSVVPCDLEGDGRTELILGTEYHTSDLLEAGGNPRWMVRGGPGFTAFGAMDLDGCGPREVIYGSLDAHVYALDARTGAVRWKALLGGGVRHAVLSEEDRCIVAGDDGGNISLLEMDGVRRWRCDLGDAVTGLAAGDVNSDGRTEWVATSASGRMAILSREGRVIGTHDTDAPVSRLAVSGKKGFRPCVIAGCRNGALEAWAWR